MWLVLILWYCTKTLNGVFFKLNSLPHLFQALHCHQFSMERLSEVAPPPLPPPPTAAPPPPPPPDPPPLPHYRLWNVNSFLTRSLLTFTFSQYGHRKLLISSTVLSVVTSCFVFKYGWENSLLFEQFRIKAQNFCVFSLENIVSIKHSFFISHFIPL